MFLKKILIIIVSLFSFVLLFNSTTLYALEVIVNDDVITLDFSQPNNFQEQDLVDFATNVVKYVDENNLYNFYDTDNYEYEEFVLNDYSLLDNFNYYDFNNYDYLSIIVLKYYDLLNYELNYAFFLKYYDDYNSYLRDILLFNFDSDFNFVEDLSHLEINSLYNFSIEYQFYDFDYDYKDNNFNFIIDFFDFINAPFKVILQKSNIYTNHFTLGLGQVEFFTITIGQFVYVIWSFLILFLLFRFFYRLLSNLMRSIFGNAGKKK